MGGSLVKLKCTSCGATLEVDKESLGKYMFCSSCGTKYVYESSGSNNRNSEFELLERGIQLLELGNHSYAAEVFDEMMRKYPQNYKGWLGRYLCIRHTALYIDESSDLMRNARILSPEDSPLRSGFNESSYYVIDPTNMNRLKSQKFSLEMKIKDLDNVKDRRYAEFQSRINNCNKEILDENNRIDGLWSVWKGNFEVNAIRAIKFSLITGLKILIPYFVLFVLIFSFFRDVYEGWPFFIGIYGCILLLMALGAYLYYSYNDYGIDLSGYLEEKRKAKERIEESIAEIKRLSEALKHTDQLELTREELEKKQYYEDCIQDIVKQMEVEKENPSKMFSLESYSRAIIDILKK